MTEEIEKPRKREKPKIKKRGRTAEGLSIALEARQVQEMARLGAPEALQAVRDIITSEISADMAKIAAAHLILDRGYGKSTQTNINATVDADAKAKDINAKDLDQRISEALTSIERITGGARPKIESEKRPVDIRVLN